MRVFFPRYLWVVLVVILISIPVVFLLVKMYVSKNSLTINNAAPTPKTINSCAYFTAVAGEITCEKARIAALVKYPGQVLDIRKTVLPYRSGIPPETKIEDRKVWLVRIKPNDSSSLPKSPQNPISKENQTIESIGAVVDRNTNKILFIQTSF